MNKNKKKLLTILLLAIVLIISFIEKRSFYCLDKNRCVTLWKRVGGSCFVIPGRYYGLFAPKDNYILTKKSNNIDIIWNEDPINFIVAIDKNSEIINNSKKIVNIINYNNHEFYYDNLYTFFDGKYKRYKSETIFISINIKENYALGKGAVKL